MEILFKDINSLKPYSKNARTHSDRQVSQIVESIKEFGFTNPVLIDKNNGIIAGHGRVMAAQKIGMDEVPTIELSKLTETQKRAYILADNQLALNAGWDDELLRQELEDLEKLDFDISLLGFDPEIDDCFVGIDAEETEMPELRSGDREPFQQMTFTLHDDQVEQINLAIKLSKSFGEFDSLNENSNGNALARIAETYLTQNANS
jgi:ParB-like chromosome segregation protein Spo0J